MISHQNSGVGHQEIILFILPNSPIPQFPNSPIPQFPNSLIPHSLIHITDY
ncbi:hypothetical protein [Microcystis aeruginosa]|uniref:hypothetical protein n=1 Tax=Microcystis TaxID=1125 RepID=UPI00232BFA01|nr:hypothetical protein [Microcystis aeruginosa]MDB9506258.1 hypothetical protein [Microcystis aeruginosa CS-338/01]